MCRHAALRGSGVLLWLLIGSVGPNAQQPGPEYFDNQVIVQFRTDAAVASKAAVRGVVAARSSTEIKTATGGLELITTDLPVPEAIALLQAQPGVEFAEPNWRVRHQAISNDPYYTDGSLWGMYGDSSPLRINEFGSQAGEAWANGYTGSNGVYVVIIDEGLDFNHPDLSLNIWTNPYDLVDGVDNDGNGRIDDVRGWDFFNNNNSVYDGSPADLELDAHGTHVAGTIGGRGGNGFGVAGVNWNVTMISAKFLGPEGGPISAAIQAVEYATDLKTRHGLNIIATNNSWGGGGYSQAMHQAIIRAAKQGILFVAAAGNDALNNDAESNYPSNYATNVTVGAETSAGYDAVIAVASITSFGALSSFSNYGATTVDLGAPGSGIFSTTPQNGYSSYSGTSMATPHVSGAVALLKSINPGLTASEIKAYILSQAIATPSLTGVTATGKRLNAGDFAPLVRPNLTINDVAVAEGQAGTKTATFTASLSQAVSHTVSVNYATSDGTALASPGSSHAYSNNASIVIPSVGVASPFPSTITVPDGIPAPTKVMVTLIGLSHTWPEDVDILLVGPGGQSTVLLSDAGGSIDVVTAVLAFDDSGAFVPSTIVTGTYVPTNLGTSDTFSAPAPAGPYGSTLSVFNGISPTGTWRLFVTDDSQFDSGTIAAGWSLTMFVPGTGGDLQPASGTLTFTAGSTTQPIAVTVNGDTTEEATETFNVTLSGALLATITDGAAVGAIVNDDTPYTDSTLAGGVTFVKAVHIVELRTRVNELRTLKGLPAATWINVMIPGFAFILATDIHELRLAINEVYTATGRTPPVYTDPELTGTTIKAVHISELRSAILNAY